MPIVPGRVSDDRLGEMAESARRLDWSYDHVGATASGVHPAGYRVAHYAADVGAATVFDRAVEGLRRWEAHRGAGARVMPAGAPLVAGETVVVALGLLAMTLVAPCRVAYVTEEADRFGFAYGTLTGHPAQGEESFHVVRDGGRARFEVAALSRPAGRLARAGGPVARLLQDVVVRRYLHALRAFAQQG